MNKKKLIDKITERVNLKKKDVGVVVDICFEEIMKTIKDEGRVNLVGFGSFELRHRPSREGRSPVDHQKIMIPSSYYVGFKSGSVLKKIVKDNYE